ncbi:hypothetical protein M2418_002104 [Rhizobium sp. BIGb0125]|jgi:hypothetical protein|uniref:hypothetical protein n=1 Tax=Rhizobium sp. BIGb0125 TaxID=2940618 RepID=UPI00216AAD59|nr:hypothetical protein [Rhizobium sp. BIGb0125]MCS4242578.1 hypothetical protein [Rhizobium sp. BIGb0125]
MYSANQRPAAADFTHQPKPERKAPVQAGAGAAGRSAGLSLGGCIETMSPNRPFRLTGTFAKLLFTTRPHTGAEYTRYMLAVEDWCHAETDDYHQANADSEPAYQMRRAALLASRIGQAG